MDRAERERLRALAAGASAGPWSHDNVQGQSAVICGQPPGLVAPWGTTFENAAFVAAANPAAVVALLDALDAAERRAEGAEAALRFEHGEGPGEEFIGERMMPKAGGVGRIVVDDPDAEGEGGDG